MSTPTITHATPAEDASTGTLQLVVFSVHGERYALPITAVREIIRYITPGASGAAAGAVQGMISLRGRVLPVMDLGAQLGNPCEIAESTKILVVDLDGRSIGMIVDAVEEVLYVDAEQIETVDSDGALSNTVAKVDDQLIVLLDANRIRAGV